VEEEKRRWLGHTCTPLKSSSSHRYHRPIDPQPTRQKISPMGGKTWGDQKEGIREGHNKVIGRISSATPLNHSNGVAPMCLSNAMA
jgi:hypothetical protein